MTTASRAGRTPTRRHGLGKSGVDALLASQGGVCAICGVPYEDKPGSRLAMDHDHKHCPGPKGCPVCVRGLLCNRCNNLVRLSAESEDILLKTIAYLQQHQVRAT